MTLAENLAFLAGFAEGLSKGKSEVSGDDSEEDGIEALIADIDLDLPENGWQPADRF